MFTLDVKKRNKNEDLEAIRKTGKIPAVFYGKKEASTPITVSSVDFIKLFKQAGESSVISLKGDGIEVEALIQEVDRRPVSGKPRHADFYVFEKGKKIKIDIPLEFIGTSPAVKDLGGILVKVLHSLEIEALPKDLPHKIQVDISSLATFSSVISAKDIKLGDGVTLVASPEEIVASVYEPKEEVEVAPTIDLTTIEVAKKGKEAKEGAEGAAPADAAPAKDAKASDKKK
jgi:large subunit ribosomal protein L25